MSHDNALRLIGLARKAGKLEIGDEPVGAAARARQAKLILVAEDAAANTYRRAGHFGESGNVLFLTVPFTKAELGNALGRTSCAMLAMMDTGFAASLIKKLAAEDPERYGPAAEQLDTKARRVLQRQREERAHEKNLREGKHKPWTPPTPPSRSAKPSRADGQSPRTSDNGKARRTAAPVVKHGPPPSGGMKFRSKFPGRQKKTP